MRQLAVARSSTLSSPLPQPLLKRQTLIIEAPGLLLLTLSSTVINYVFDLYDVCRGDPEAKAEYDAIASAVFSSPPLASVGPSEEQAIEQYGDVDVFTSSFK